MAFAISAVVYRLVRMTK